MKIVAVIAEYNPLHKGHCLHLAHAKSLGDRVLVVQNGDFGQRGLSCVLDKYTRAVHAIKAGADIVVEMPCVYGVNCADKFAYGGTRMLRALHCPVTLSFGSEAGDIDALAATQRIMSDEPTEVSQSIQQQLNNGVAYPIARATAYAHWAGEHGYSMCDISQPNNILALEYMRHGVGLQFDTIPRTQAYHTTDNGSASGIRLCIQEGRLSEAQAGVPPYVWRDLSACTPERDVLYLAAARYWGQNDLYDAKEGLQNRIRNAARQADTLPQALQLCATKRYTNARIRRLFTYALLGLDADKAQKCIDQPVYYNVLAVRRNATALLSMLSEAGDVYTGQDQLYRGNLCAELDAHAHELYGLLHAMHPANTMQIVDEEY